MANTQEINDLQNPISKLDDLETKTNKTLDNLFTQEKTLIESIKDEKLKKAAQEEYEEMLNKYKQEKESIHQEVSKNILNDIKNEFKEDINSLQIILSNSNDLMKNEELYFDDEKGFETFIKLLNTNEKNGGFNENEKEQIYYIFKNIDFKEIKDCIQSDLGSNIIDSSKLKDFINKFINNINKTEQEKLNKLDLKTLEYYEKNIDKYYELFPFKSDDKKIIIQKIITEKTQNLKMIEKESAIAEEKSAITKKESAIAKTESTITKEISKNIENENKAKIFSSELKELDLENNLNITNPKIKNLIQFLSNENNISNPDYQKFAVDLMQELTKKENSGLLREFIQAIPADKRQAFINNFTNFVKSSAIEKNDNEASKLAENFKIEARKHIDIVIDGGKTTIVGENGYTLEVGYSSKELQKIMQDPINVMTNKERAEFTDKKIELKTQINELDDKIKSLDDTIEKVKLLKELQKNPEANKENISKLEQILGKIEILKEVHSIEELESKKYELVKNKEEKTSELENLETSFHKELEKRFEEKSIQGLEDEEKTRQTTLLLDSIGFTLIPQHITDDIIASINKNPEHYGFESRIDLKNGNFGGINTIATKERFIKKFNKMISGKEGEPITKDEIDNILVKKLERDKDSQEEKNKELINKFSTYNIMNELGVWDREKLESNLKLKEKENPQTEK